MKQLAILSTTLVLLFSAALRASDDTKNAAQKPQSEKNLAPPPKAVQIQVQQIAQPPGRPVLYRGPNKLYLLRNPKVVKELGLDGDQQEEVTEAQQELNKSRREQSKKLRALKPQERAKKFQELYKKYNADIETKVKEILKKEQVERLDQIVLQMQGIRALQDPVVVKKLKITEDQKKNFQKVQTEGSEKRAKLFKDFRAGNVEQATMREKMQQIRTETDKKTIEVLTKEQQSQFEKLKGKKFDLGRRGVIGIRPGIQPRKINGKIKIRRIRVMGKQIRPRKAKTQKAKNDK